MGTGGDWAEWRGWEKIPTCSKADLTLIKAELFSNDGNISEIIYLRRRQKLLWKSSWKRGVRKCKRSSSANQGQVREEGR